MLFACSKALEQRFNTITKLYIIYNKSHIEKMLWFIGFAVKVAPKGK